MTYETHWVYLHKASVSDQYQTEFSSVSESKRKWVESNITTESVVLFMVLQVEYL